MEFKDILGFLIFIAIIGFKFIMPIIKGMKETDAIEKEHKNRPRPSRPNAAPLRREPENTGRRFEAFPPPNHPPAFEPRSEFFVIPPEVKEAYKKKGKAQKERKPSETPQEALARLARENAATQARKREAGEICDECYDEHSDEGRYAAIMRNQVSLVDALVAAEILGKPLSLRGDGGVFDSKF